MIDSSVVDLDSKLDRVSQLALYLKPRLMAFLARHFQMSHAPCVIESRAFRRACFHTVLETLVCASS